MIDPAIKLLEYQNQFKNRNIENINDNFKNIELNEKIQKVNITSIRNIDKKYIAMVGDNLYTDIEAANQANVLAILVLSGVSTLENAKNYLKKNNRYITCYSNSVGDLTNILKQIYQKKNIKENRNQKNFEIQNRNHNITLIYS